jgi:hypothetical protein
VPITKPPTEPQAEDPYAGRRGITFEQAERAEPLAAQLKPKELSPHFRAMAWAFVLQGIESDNHYDGYSDYVDGEWDQIMKDRRVHRLHRPVDEFSPLAKTVLPTQRKSSCRGLTLRCLVSSNSS